MINKEELSREELKRLMQKLGVKTVDEVLTFLKEKKVGNQDNNIGNMQNGNRGFIKTKEKMAERLVGMVYGNLVTDTGRKKLNVVIFNLKGIENIQLFALESKVNPGNYQIYRADMAYINLFKKGVPKEKSNKKDSQTVNLGELYPS